MSEKEKNIVPSTAEAEMSEEEKQKLLEQFDKESKTRKFGSPVLKKAYRVFAIIVTLYHLVFASGLYMPETLKHRSIHVGMILILAFMLYPATKKASRKVIAWYDYVFIALSAAVPIYMCVDYVNIINRAGKPDMMDVVIGTLLTLVVLEATRRVCGMALPIISIIFMIYSLMGTKQGLIPIDVPGIFLHRGYTWQKLMSHFFSNTEGIYGSSVNVASTKAGVNLDAIGLMGRIIKQTAELTKDNDSMGCSKLVVFANAVDDNPFMAGAFHGIGEPETVINVGVSGPGVVQSAIRRAGDCSIGEVADVIKKTAFKITRMGQLVGALASQRLGVPFGIVDLSLAPTPAIGDSVARILEEVGLEVCGGCGTTAILAMLNDAVKKGGVMASSSVGGLSGAFIPVSEDEGMIAAAQAGALTLEKLEAMTAVCSVGIDMVAVPGDTTAEVISGLIADEIAIGVVNTKTTAVRVIPAIGKKVGDMVEFGGLLGAAPIMPIKTGSPAKFIGRGGRIPAPIQSLKN